MPETYLIINADDFGMCHAANAATFDLFEKGGITSATIMTPCGWAPEALRFAASHPEYAIGVHLTLTSEWSSYRWRPVSATPCPTLRDSAGYLPRSCAELESQAVEQEVEAEIRAQIALARQAGLSPSHLDNHMGSLYGLEQNRCFLPTVLRICAELRMPFRLPCVAYGAASDGHAPHFERMVRLAQELRVPMPDYLWEYDWHGPQSASYQAFRDDMLERFHRCPDGLVEMYIHPSLECDELKGTSSVWFRRVWEHRLFADPATRRHMEALGIRLINYRDLKQLREVFYDKT